MLINNASPCMGANEGKWKNRPVIFEGMWSAGRAGPRKPRSLHS